MLSLSLSLSSNLSPRNSTERIMIVGYCGFHPNHDQLSLMLFLYLLLSFISLKISISPSNHATAIASIVINNSLFCRSRESNVWAGWEFCRAGCQLSCHINLWSLWLFNGPVHSSSFRADEPLMRTFRHHSVHDHHSIAFRTYLSSFCSVRSATGNPVRLHKAENGMPVLGSNIPK